MFKVPCKSLAVIALLLAGCSDSPPDAETGRAVDQRPISAKATEPSGSELEAATDESEAAAPDSESPGSIEPETSICGSSGPKAPEPWPESHDPLSLAKGEAPAGYLERASLRVGGLNGVECVAFTSDGTRLAAGHWDGRITIWDPTVVNCDAEFPAPLTTILAHDDVVAALEFSPNGQRLYSSGQDHKVLVWDVSSGSQVRQVAKLDMDVEFLDLSPDGKLLASATGVEARVHQADTGRKLWQAEAFGPLAFSPDGETLVLKGRDDIQLHDAASGRVIGALDRVLGYCNNLEFSPDGKTLVASGSADDDSDTKLLVWFDMPEGKERLRQKVEDYGPLVFSPDGRLMAIVEKNRVQFLRAPTGEKIRHIDFGLSLECLAFSPSGRYFVAGTGSIVGAFVIEVPAIFDFATQRAVDELRKREGYINSVRNGLTIDLKFQDSDLALLKAIDRPLRISIRYDSTITDAGLEHLAGSRNIESLQLDSENEITDAGLAHLAGLTQLKLLDLSKTKVTDKGLQYLEGMTELTTLRLPNEVTDAGLAHLSKLTRLKELTVESNKITDAGLAHLAGLTQLTKLELKNVAVSGPGLEQLAGMTRLEELTLDSEVLTNRGLANLPKLARLKRLSLWGCRGVTDAGLLHLARTPNLEWLDLWLLSHQGGAGLSHLTALKKLKYIRLPDGIADPSLRPLADLPELEQLDFDDLQGTASAGLAEIARKRDYVNLDLRKTDVNDETLVHFKHLKQVTGLWLPPQITDAGLVHLADMTQLESLDLADTSVTDAGLAHLSRLIHLHTLNLEDTQVTEAGLIHLKDNTRLRQLGIPSPDDFFNGTGPFDLSAASFPITEDSIYAVSFSPDGKTLAIAAGDAEVKRIDVAGRKVLTPFSTPMTKVTSAVYTPNGEFLAVGGDGEFVVLLGAQSGDKGRELKLPDNDRIVAGVTRLLVPQPGNELVGATYTNAYRWYLNNNDSPLALENFSSIECLALRPDGQQLVAHYQNRHICSWDMLNGDRKRVWHDTYSLAARAVVFSSDGKWLASGNDRTIELRDPSSLELKHTIATEDEPECLAALPDRNAILQGSSTGIVSFWSMPEGQHLRTLKCEPASTIRHLAVSPDGKTLATASYKTVKLWDLTKLLPPADK